MSITKMSIFIAIFIAMMLQFNSIRENNVIRSSKELTKNTDIISGIIDDTSTTMIRTSSYNNDVFQMDTEACLKAFEKAASVRLNIEDNDSLYSEFLNHVPLIIFIEGDGLYSYSMISTGGTFEHILHEKRYFTQYDAGDNMLIKYSFSDYYEVLDLDKEITYRGTYKELKALNVAPTVFSKPQDEIEAELKSIVTEIVNDELLRINDHNRYAKAIGIGYEFFIPDSTSTFDNEINGPGLLTCIQGVNAGTEDINIFSMSAATVGEAFNYEGYDNAGKLVYYRTNAVNKTGTLVEVFDTAVEAAKAGYYP